MKHFIFLFLSAILYLNGNGQNNNNNDESDPQPLFAVLNKMKVEAEDAIKMRFLEQQLNIDTIPDDPKGKKKEIQRLKDFKTNEKCIKAYNALRSSMDQLITQLKADLTISNKKKLLKELNSGTGNKNSWYKKMIDQIVTQRMGVTNCIEGKALAVSLEEITGLFSALAGIVTSARDFRAQQIKALCEQLESLRLSPIDKITSGGEGEKKEEKKEDSK